jgi:glycosyltransferase involved in cell wall biosynthesis
MNRFIVVIPVYNGEQTIDHCIDSVRKQEYSNYDFIVIDDCSTDETYKEICRYGAKVIRNTSRKGSATANIIRGIREMSKDSDDIIVIVDGDDYLKDNYVLKYLNEIYVEGVWLTYGQYESISGRFNNICQPLNRIHTCKPNGQKTIISVEPSEYRTCGVWCTSHLKTFKRWLFDRIDNRDLRNETGEYFKTCCDVCLMFPMIEMAGSHIKFVDKILYVYNDITNNYNDKERAKENLRNFRYLQKKQRYKEI